MSFLGDGYRIIWKMIWMNGFWRKSSRIGGRSSNSLFKMIMWSEWHEHCSILQKPTFSASIFHHSYHWTPHPFSVSTPSKLYVNSSPCSPVGRVKSCCSLQSLIREFVAEVIGYVLQMVCFQGKCFCWFNANKCSGWSWKSLQKWATKTPR